MSYFSKVYNNIKKELLSEQEELNNEPEMEQETLQSMEDEPTISNNETSEIKNVENDSINVDWVNKIIDLLTLLNREDQTVKGIISDLTKDEVNADTLKQKEDLIDELIRTIPIEKKT